MKLHRIPGASLLLGSGFFNFASGCYTIALGQSLFETTGSVGAFTAVVTIEYVGPILLGMLAGSLSDRINAALLCMWAALLAAVSLCVYLSIPGTLSSAGIALGLAINILRPFYRAGIFAAGPRSVSPDSLVDYNLRWTVSVQTGQIVGGAVGGLVLSVAGSKLAFGVAASAFFISSVAMYFAKSQVKWVPNSSSTVKNNWLDVLRYFAGWPKVLSLLLVGVDFVTISMFTVSLAPLVGDIFNSAIWLGILDAFFAFGAILISSMSGRVFSIKRRSHRRVISVGYIIQIAGLLMVAIGIRWGAVGPVCACLGSVVLGAGMALSASQQVSFLQDSVGGEAAGKVGALRQAVIGLTTASALPLLGMAIGLNLLAAYLGLAVFLAICIFLNFSLSRFDNVAWKNCS
ncbi:MULTISPECIES: MFS transporter [unclassified Corynebacterium]|uniref:MFS transporter n=1 Tax=unclassified Corynebacterium TaxID=2624378 RepID=UPI000AD26D9B|nr:MULTISPECIES: MFS transporter [unclassified Corynebacterium]